MQGAFIQSLTYSPPSVLGLQLRPFSPWHGLVLEAAGSPYLVGGLCGADDLVLGAWVCSKSFSEGFGAAADAVAARKWGRKLNRVRYAVARVEFDEYIKANFMMPIFWTAKGGQSIKAPYWWHLATFAMRDLGMSEAEAWDASAARLACYQACTAECNGNRDLVGDELKKEA